MTGLSADKRQKPPVTAAGKRAADATQDVFARQEDLFTVVSPEND